MAERVAVVLGNDDACDTLVRGGLPEGGYLTIVTKDHATEGGRAAAVIAFSVQRPSGQVAAVQAVTTVGDGSGSAVRTFDKVN